MKTLIEEIKKLAEMMHAQVVANRRHLHRYPELSFHEFETSCFIKEQLTAAGIAWECAGETGIVGKISGSIQPGKTIVLRADMDALPVAEENDVDYRSQRNGVMHACGHDTHTACLLGAAAILQSLRHRLRGTVKLAFQPAEEKIPGGAVAMIKHGVLGNPPVAGIVGQHVAPFIKSGFIGIRKGRFMASMDEIFLTVYGRGGHGAQPHQNIDPVLIASHIVVAMQQVASRYANPIIPTVLSFGKIIGDGAVNIIPAKAFIEGTFRTTDEQWRDEAHKIIRRLAQGIAVSMGGICDVNIVKGYPCLVNDEVLVKEVIAAATEYLGGDKIVQTDIWMAAEDFAYYTQQAAGCFYLLGTSNSEETSRSLHTSNFAIDEGALVHGAGLMAYIAARQLIN
ncbi:MAG TPA: M20 family metallopeptidase [Chitinophagaceae bacterium]|nr:M20 family metallopeptidase [Chitinophagaceae bacterium]